MIEEQQVADDHGVVGQGGTARRRHHLGRSRLIGEHLGDRDLAVGIEEQPFPGPAHDDLVGEILAERSRGRPVHNHRSAGHANGGPGQKLIRAVAGAGAHPEAQRKRAAVLGIVLHLDAQGGDHRASRRNDAGRFARRIDQHPGPQRRAAPAGVGNMDAVEERGLGHVIRLPVGETFGAELDTGGGHVTRVGHRERVGDEVAALQLGGVLIQNGHESVAQIRLAHMEVERPVPGAARGAFRLPGVQVVPAIADIGRRIGGEGEVHRAARGDLIRRVCDPGQFGSLQGDRPAEGGCPGREVREFRRKFDAREIRRVGIGGTVGHGERERQRFTQVALQRRQKRPCIPERGRTPDILFIPQSGTRHPHRTQ